MHGRTGKTSRFEVQPVFLIPNIFEVLSPVIENRRPDTGGTERDFAVEKVAKSRAVLLTTQNLYIDCLRLSVNS
jgi:hypothetical protein